MSTIKANRIENLTTTDGGININNSGNVGIGTSSPSHGLTIHKSGTSTFDALNITSGLTNSVGLQFGIDSSSNAFFWHTANGGIKFATNNAERVRVTNNGLTFNGNTAAANALDDYEEGTWTPTISNTGYTYTYSTQEGQYTKIGRLVTLRFRIVVTARSGSASGGHGIVNLPLATDGTLNASPYHSAMPTELIFHKASTTTSSGARTLLCGGIAHSNTSNFWINNPTVSTAGPFDLGSDFNIGGVITYTSNA
jgi:hypothetical protein